MSVAIDVRGLTERYGNRAVVDDIALQVGSGRIVGFLGPNGNGNGSGSSSGNTTTLRMLCRLLTPHAGEGQAWAWTSAARPPT